MKKPIRRTLLVLAAVVGLLLLFLPLTYAILARIVGASVTGDIETVEILAPEAPLAGDSSMTTLLALADTVDWADEDACKVGVPLSDQEEACRAVIERNTELIVQLAAWADDPGPLGPRQREALGKHARAPVGVGISVELPPLVPLLRLADLLVAEVELSFRDGDCDAGQRSLRLLFDVGTYFEHNPSTLLHEMVGVAITDKAARAAADNVPGSRAAAVSAWLPTEANRLHSLQIALGSEWLNFVTFLESELPATDGPFADVSGGSATVSWDAVRIAGLYDPVHTRQMHDRFWQQVQQATRAPPLVAGEIDVQSWDSMGLVKYVHNPIGRILFSIAVPSYQRFGQKVGSSIDRIAALRVVLAARAFHLREDRWPTGIEELGLTAPRSTLNERALPWNAQHSGLRLFDEEGEKPCEVDDDECFVPFAPGFAVTCGA